MNLFYYVSSSWISACFQDTTATMPACILSSVMKGGNMGEHYPLELSVLTRWSCIIFKMALALLHIFVAKQGGGLTGRPWAMDGHGNLCRINHWTPHILLMVEADKPGRPQVLRGAFFSFSCTDIQTSPRGPISKSHVK